MSITCILLLCIKSWFGSVLQSPRQEEKYRRRESASAAPASARHEATRSREIRTAETERDAGATQGRTGTVEHECYLWQQWLCADTWYIAILTVRPSVCLSVCHIPVFCPNDNSHHTFFSPNILVFPALHIFANFRRYGDGRWIQVGYTNFAVFTYCYKNNFVVIVSLILNLKVELALELAICQLCYQSADGDGGLSCCYFVCAVAARYVSDS